MNIRFLIGIFVTLLLSACAFQSSVIEGGEHGMSPGLGYARAHLHEYARAPVSISIDSLPDTQQTVVKHLINAAVLIDELYWYEIYGDKDVFMGGIEHLQIAQLASIQYGPWDRFADNHLFVDYARQRPPGANFYPLNMTREEIIESTVPKLESPYTIIRRSGENQLQAVYYHDAFALQIREICKHLEQAAQASTDENFKQYLNQRIMALKSDDYWESEQYWMDLRESPVNLIIGPISEDDDQLLGVKKAHAASILLRDREAQADYDDYKQAQERLLAKLSREFKQPLLEHFIMLDVDVYHRLLATGRANLPNRQFVELFPSDERVEIEKGKKMLLYHNISELVLDSLVNPMIQNSLDMAHWNELDQAIFEKIHTLRLRMLPGEGHEGSPHLPGIAGTDTPEIENRHHLKQLIAYYITYQLLLAEEVVEVNDFATTLVAELLYAVPDYDRPTVESSVLTLAIENELLIKNGKNHYAVKSDKLEVFLDALKGRIGDSLVVLQEDVATAPEPLSMPSEAIAFFEEMSESTSPKHLVVITPPTSFPQGEK